MKRSVEAPAARLRRTAVVRTDYHKFEIWKSALATEFRVSGATHAFHHRHRFLTGLVWDMLAAAALLGKREEPRSLLMLGLAGGTTLRLLRHLLPACRFTALEIDAQMVRLARRHMALDATGVEVIVGDAYAWLRANRRTFDVVIDDIYLAGRTDVFRAKAMNRPLLADLRRGGCTHGEPRHRPGSPHHAVGNSQNPPLVPRPIADRQGTRGDELGPRCRTNRGHRFPVAVPGDVLRRDHRPDPLARNHGASPPLSGRDLKVEHTTEQSRPSQAQ